jgi:hypothetical protein
MQFYNEKNYAIWICLYLKCSIGEFCMYVNYYTLLFSGYHQKENFQLAVIVRGWSN